MPLSLRSALLTLAILCPLTVVGPSASAQQLSSSSGANCATYTAGDFEIGLNLSGEYLAMRVKVYNVTTGALVSNDAVYQSTTVPGTADCHWVAHVGEPAPAGRVELDSNTLYRIDFSNLGQNFGWSYYYLLEKDNNEAGASIFTPRGFTGDRPDLLFFLGDNGFRVYPTALQGGSSGRDVDDYFPGGWVLPYDLPTICASTGCDPEYDTDYMFLTPTAYTTAAPSGLPLALTSTGSRDWIVPSARDYTWDDADVSQIRFKDGLTVKGELDVNGLALKPSSSSWGGITVSNGTLTLDDAEVRDASSRGVYATGSSADVTITGKSVIRSSGFNGVQAVNGSDVTIEGESRIIDSGSIGVSARGSGTHVVIRDAFVQEGSYYATQSDIYADIDLRNTPNPARLNTNDAGVRAELAGETDTGVAGGNRIVRDPNGPSQNSGVYQDVFAMDAAYIDVSHTYWGTGVTSSNDLAITGGYEDNVVIVDPVLTTDPANGAGSVQSSGVQFTRASESGPSQSGRTGRSARSGPFVSQAGAGTVQGWVEVAERSSGDEAVEAIAAALDVAEAEGELRMAWSAAARLAARFKTRPELRDAASSARLDALATASLQDAGDAPWARRVLALSAFHGETPDAARPHLDALARVPSDRSASRSDESTPLSHAAFAHLMTVRLALNAEDAPRALDALAALARTDAYQANVAEQGIQAAFPEVDASIARAQGAAEARAQRAQLAMDVPLEAGLTVQPNPSAGQVQLGITLKDTADLDVSIYDALGRRVRHVARGTMEAGSHRLDADLTELPAGVYLARLTTADYAQTVRFTVTR